MQKHRQNQNLPKPKPLRRPLLPFVAMIGRHWPAMAKGGLLSLSAGLAAIGLLSLSGWFIAATAFAGLQTATAKAFNFFLPSIGVRLFAIMRTLSRYGERVMCHDATFRILETLRTWCYARLEPLSPARLGEHHTGDLLTRIITDIDTLDNLYLRVLTPTLVATAVFVLLVSFVGYFSPIMALLCGVMYIIGGVVIPVISDRAARPAARSLSEETARLRAALVDGIQGLAALLACGAGGRYLEKVGDMHRALVRSENRLSHITGWTHAMMGMVSGLTVAGILFIGVGLVSEGSLSGPQLALLTLAVMAGFDAVTPLANAFQYLGQTRKAAVRLHEVTTAQPAVTFAAKETSVSPDGPLEFDGVSFSYEQGRTPALKDINFRIQPGRHIAIMGATGSGKSTLLYLLSRFEDPSEGEIRLNRRALSKLAEETLRANLCIVSQKAHIFNGTIRENLLLARPDADTDALNAALAAVQLADFVRALPQGLDTWVGESGKLLSGGQSRRLTIARAVLSPAAIWALDEPTEGLDTETAKTMMHNLLDRQRGKTVLMVTHRSEAVEQMDKVIVLEAGRVAAIGTPDYLDAHHALYRRLLSK